MTGLEIVMDIDTLEIYQVIDHDSPEVFPADCLSDKTLDSFVQLDLFDSVA